MRKPVLTFCLFAVLLYAAYPQTKKDNIGSSNAYSNLSQGEKDSLLWEVCGKSDPTRRDDAIFSLLLRAGANVNFVPDGENWNLLYETMCHQQGYFLKRLIDAGCDVGARWTTEEDGVKTPELSPVAFAMDREIDFALIRALVDAGADITSDAGTDHGIVYYAIEKEYPVDEVTYFLEKGAPASCGTVAGKRPNDADLPYEPINLACSNGDAKLVHLLERYGADVRIPGKPYGSSINAAAAGGNLELAKYCLGKGLSCKGKDSDGYKALGYAVITGHREIADYLHSLGADIDAAFDNGNTILINILEYATQGISDDEQSADLTAAYYALKLGANPLLKNAFGECALSVATRHAVDAYSCADNRQQYAKIARFMLDGLAATSYRMSATEACLMNDVAALRRALPEFDKTRGESPFAYAFASGKNDCVDLLYAAGLQPSAKEVAFGLALGNFDAIDRCVKNGFDVNANVVDDDNIISYCESRFHYADSALVRMYSFLYDEGFGVSGRIHANGTDWTPLAYFAHRMNKGKDGLLPIILRHGADIDGHFGDNSRTALMASMSNYESFMFLADRGANLLERDADGHTVFDLCDAQDADYRVVMYLKSISEIRGMNGNEKN